jgi:hypothetical protein
MADILQNDPTFKPICTRGSLPISGLFVKEEEERETEETNQKTKRITNKTFVTSFVHCLTSNVVVHNKNKEKKHLVFTGLIVTLYIL